VARSGRPDAEEVDVVVGGAVGGRLKITCRGCPAVSAGGARTGGACATGASPAPGLLCSGKLNVPSEACVDEPGPESIGAMGDGPAATVAMSRATWAAVVVRVCGRCGVVGGLVRDVGGSNHDVGDPSRVVGGSDRNVGGLGRA
jgi:hypothetical protein